MVMNVNENTKLVKLPGFNLQSFPFIVVGNKYHASILDLQMGMKEIFRVGILA